MEGLGALDHFNPRGGLIVAAGILVIGEDSAFAPKVALVDIVIVRDANSGTIFGDFPSLQNPEIPFVKVVVVAVEICPTVFGCWLTFVDLIAEGEEDIWVVFGNVIEGESMGLPNADGGPVEAVILDFSVSENRILHRRKWMLAICS